MPAQCLLGTCLPQGVTLLREALAFAPGDADAIIELAACLRREGRYEDALEALHGLPASRAERPEVLQLMTDLGEPSAAACHEAPCFYGRLGTGDNGAGTGGSETRFENTAV